MNSKSRIFQGKIGKVTVRKVYRERSRLVMALVLIAVAASASALTAYLTLDRAPAKPPTEMLLTKEPLLITPPTPQAGSFYLLPAGAVLQRAGDAPGGQKIYSIHFQPQGEFAYETFPSAPGAAPAPVSSPTSTPAQNPEQNLPLPLQVKTVDAETLKAMFKRFPLSRKDAAAAIKANELTRKDLSEIMRALPK